jgi:hypothetical protein
LARPLTGPTFAAVNSGYRSAFTISAGLLVAATVLAMFLKVPKDDAPTAEAAPVA